MCLTVIVYDSKAIHDIISDTHLIMGWVWCRYVHICCFMLLVDLSCSSATCRLILIIQILNAFQISRTLKDMSAYLNQAKFCIFLCIGKWHHIRVARGVVGGGVVHQSQVDLYVIFPNSIYSLQVAFYWIHAKRWHNHFNYILVQGKWFWKPCL